MRKTDVTDGEDRTKHLLKLVTIENGQTVLYVKFQKALYGCLKSVLLFDDKLVLDLNSRGFTINPYYSYVANIIINENQMAISWHVDNLKIMHVDTDEVTKVIYWMKGIYGSHMKESRWKKSYFLRMELDLSVDVEVWVTIKDCLNNIVSGFTETI